MTHDILAWLQFNIPAFLQTPGRVLEVGAQNINGSPRPFIAPLATEYIGTDMQAGVGVDRVVHNTELIATFGVECFDTILCCECLEHDVRFWDTVQQMRDLLKPGGLLVITTPALGFHYHAYPRHYVNFTKDAYEDMFFAGMTILELRHINSPCGEQTTLAGIARK